MGAIKVWKRQQEKNFSTTNLNNVLHVFFNCKYKSFKVNVGLLILEMKMIKRDI